MSTAALEELTVPEDLSWSREEDMIAGVCVRGREGNAREEGIVRSVSSVWCCCERETVGLLKV